ncbi:MAG: PAS domain S-box protein [Verrucomicrobiota bacterium]|nr:PAS domain S-box protein [Verrucomicrobiota bacterium]
MNNSGSNAPFVAQEAQTEKLLVYVVDDDESLNNTVCRFLQSKGYQTQFATSGNQALKDLPGLHDAILLLDYTLSDMNSVQLITSMRANGINHPFIGMTGRGDETIAVNLMKLGALDYLPKDNAFFQRLPDVLNRCMSDVFLRRKLYAMEKAAHENADLYHTLVESANDAVLFISPQGRLVEVNKVACDLYGYTRDELLKMALIDIIRDPALIHKCKSEVEAKGRAIFSSLHWTKAGKSIPVEVSARVTTHHGESRIIAYVRDVSLRQQTEAQLREQASLLDISGDGIGVFDLTGKVQFWNHGAEMLVGWTREEVMGRNLPEAMYRECRELMVTVRQQVLQTGSWCGELVLYTKTDQPVVVLSRRTLIRDKHGAPKSILVVNTNRTEQKAMEVQLQLALAEANREIARRKEAEAVARVRLKALDVAVRGFAITTPEGDILYVNRAFESITGYSAQETVGTRRACIFPPNYNPTVMSELRSLLLQGKFWHGELPNTRKDGTAYDEELTITPVMDTVGQVTHFIVVKHDISQRNKEKKEQALMEAQLRHAQKMESIGQLAAGIAHEINTPTQFVNDNLHFMQTSFAELNPVITACLNLSGTDRDSQTLATAIHTLAEAVKKADCGFLMDEIPRAIDESINGIKRVASIVRAMKEFSHPGAQVMTSVDINHAISNTITVARNEWKYVAELVTQLDPNLPMVMCLEGEFNQVILNLIVNAAHAIAEKLGKNPNTKGEIALSTRSAGAWVEIDVSDTGTGIPEKHRGKIFDPFFTTKEVGRGTGQGLTIAHSVIVDKLGGSITFDTEMGVGTTFHIRLPIKGAEMRH